MLKLLSLLLWWALWCQHWLESIVANVSKEIVYHIDHYLLPIYKSPFIEAAEKPPTAFA